MNKKINIYEGRHIVESKFICDFQSDLLSPYVLKNNKFQNILNIEKILNDFGVKVFSSNYSDNYRDKIKLPQEEVPFVWAVNVWPNERHVYDSKLGLKKIAYPRDNKHRFLKAIGFNLSIEKDNIYTGIDNYTKTNYLIQALYNLYIAGIEVNNPIYFLSKSVVQNGKRITEGERGNVNILLELEWNYSDDYLDC